MVATLEQPEQAAPPRDYLYLEQVPWEMYEGLLQARQRSGRKLPITYDGGRLEIMSKGPAHEMWKYFPGRLIATATYVLGLEVASRGETTFKEQRLEKGFEPDQSFYIGPADDPRDLRRARITDDYPPDLTVEIDVTHRSLDREPIHAAFRVRELWRCDGQHVRFLALGDNGRYQSIDRSTCLPPLTPGDVQRFVQMVPEHGENATPRRFEQWLRDQG